MTESGSTPAAAAAPASPRRRVGAHGLAAALLVGAGSALAFAAARTWRAAGIGLHDLPVGERWIVAVVAALGFAVGGRLEAEGRPPFHLAVVLWATVLLATGSAALGGPAWAAHPACVWLALALPAAGCGGVLGAVCAARGGTASSAAATALGGGALALSAAAALELGFSTLAALGASLLLATAVVAPGRASSPPRRTLRPVPLLALPVGGAVAWAFGLCEGFGPAPAVWPAGEAAPALFGAALGFASASRSRVVHASRIHGLAVAALAVLAASPRLDAVATAAAIGAVAAVLLRSAMGNVQPREVLHAFAAAGLGAVGAVFAVAFGLSAGVATAVLAVVASLGLVRSTSVGGFATVVGGFAVVVFGGGPASGASRGEVELGRHGCARATWSPRTQQFALELDGFVVDRAGPGRDHAVVLAFLARAFAETDGPVIAAGPECGRLVEATTALSMLDVVVTGACADTLALMPVFACDGPVEGPRQEPVARPQPLPLGSRELLRSRRPSSASAVVDASLVGPATAARATVEEHSAMRRIAGRGPVLQAFALDATPAVLVERCLRSAAAVHGFACLFVTGNSAIVLGLVGEPDFARAGARLESLPDAARWRLHAAGIGSILDLRDAVVARIPVGGCLPTDLDAAVLRHDAEPSSQAQVVAAIERVIGDRVDSIARARLDAWSLDASRTESAEKALAAIVASRPESVLLRRERLAVGIANADRSIGEVDPAVQDQVHRASVLAARYYHFGSPSPALQAALALPDAEDRRVRDRRAAGRAALALDAGFADDAPPVLRPVLSGLPAHTPFADVGRLPSGDRLVELATGDGPFAIALRSRLPSRCAEAMVASLARAEPPLSVQSALRELADPFVLRMAQRALSARGGEAELIRLWRADLPTTDAIRAVASASSAAMQAAMIAAAGRLDASTLQLLSLGLESADEPVRTAAAAALFRSLGERIVYDPSWPAELRRAAARELLELAQRNPR